MQSGEKTIRNVQTQVDDIIERARRRAIAEIYVHFKERVFRKGEDKNEKELGGYSDNKLPLWFFKANEKLGEKHQEAVKRYSNIADKLTAKNYPDGISYKSVRGLSGKQVNHVDLKFTGQTESDIQINEKNQMVFMTDYSAEVAGYNEAQYGRIYAPSKDERAIWKERLTEEFNFTFGK